MKEEYGAFPANGREACAGESEFHPKKPYAPPCLSAWGSIRSVTLGGTVGILDSGDQDIKRQPGVNP